jgi:hypothetical protein
MCTLHAVKKTFNYHACAAGKMRAAMWAQRLLAGTTRGGEDDA